MSGFGSPTPHPDRGFTATAECRSSQRSFRIVVFPSVSFLNELQADVSRRCPGGKVEAQDTMLAGIASLGRQPADIVIIGVEAAHPRLAEAVSAARRLTGPHARILLCCVPEAEPAARRAMRAGADGYVLHPLCGAQIDEALGLSAPVTWDEGRLTRVAPGASAAELEALARALTRIGGPPRPLLEALVAAVRTALRAESAALATPRGHVVSGPDVGAPVLVCPVADDAGSLGELRVGPKVRGAYRPDDAERLQVYAALSAHLLRASRRQRRWRRLAQTDALCGVLNRRAFEPRLERVLEQARDRRMPVTVVCLDLDDFKNYNDVFGHDVGDDILRRTAQLIRAGCREHDLVARLGGDEFAVVFFDPAGPRVAGSRHPESAIRVLDRFREALSRESFTPLGASGRGRLTISGGLASFPWDGGEVAALLHRADQALLEAKRLGKNRIVLVGDPDGFAPRAAAPGAP
ncbi:MAG: hypothetical protein FLDDKLPJ_03494 [Phycisphaerae bacterium]|nr:hypothetical protein [Phycisphaerae bacterium]